MLLSAVSVLVVVQSSSEIPEGLMNNPVFNLRKISELEVRKQNQVISNRFVVLEILNGSDDINRSCENVQDNTKTPAIDSLCL